jgi:hypothetical protein
VVFSLNGGSPVRVSIPSAWQPLKPQLLLYCNSGQAEFK